MDSPTVSGMSLRAYLSQGKMGYRTNIRHVARRVRREDCSGGREEAKQSKREIQAWRA